MQYRPGALTACVAVFVYLVFRRHRKRSAIKDVPGPVSPSWIFGYQWYPQTGGLEERFLENFGNIVRLDGPLGEDRLWIADPAALNHILHKSGYLYAKPSDHREQMALLADHGLLWAEGDTHQRQKRVMTPGFGPVEAKGLLPHFMDSANKMADKWSNIIENGKYEDSAIVDVSIWTRKATLDSIGTGAFEYDFGALDNADNPLTKSHLDLIDVALGNASRSAIFTLSITGWFPGFLTWIYTHSNHPGIQMLRWSREEAHVVARRLLNSKRQELKDGVARKDVMSLLVKASVSQHQDRRLTDEEIISQFRTITLAGHESTSKTTAFALWELAKHRDFQERLRAEINDTLAEVRARGDTDFTPNDFERMSYLVAITKEVLRIHPIGVEILREPIEDDVLPLTKPIVGTSGRVYKELLVPKGTAVSVSICGYNLNQDLWGPDAREFRPERWLEMSEKVESPIGVYGNLATFSGGVRSCIGWRFAVFQVQAFLVTLIQRFDFSLADKHPQIRRAGVLTPFVAGEEDKGPQLPLKITIVGNE